MENFHIYLAIGGTILYSSKKGEVNMSHDSRYSFKGLIGILLVVLGVFIGLLWGRYNPQTLAPKPQETQTVHTPTPHMSSMFPHSVHPTKHRIVVSGADMAKIFRAFHQLSAMQHAHHSMAPLAILKDFMAPFDAMPQAQDILIIRPSHGGSSNIYRIDIADAF
jgi:hypothetical protein